MKWCKEHNQPAYRDSSKYGTRKGFACTEGHHDWLKGAGLLCDIADYTAVAYSKLSWYEKRNVRNSYVALQRGKCMYCDTDLSIRPVHTRPIDLRLFPDGFLRHPIHLQHNHDTDMTEGAVHAYCNAVLWQYEGR